MNTDEPEKDWKLRLRYGRLETPYRHYTVIAEGVVSEEIADLQCPAGKAFMAMKAWAASADESADMIQAVGEQMGFTVTGRIHIYQTEPTRPPGPDPFGYDVNFTPFGADDST